MDPLTYSLCHKPVIGMLLFVASACAFPPLLDEAPFALQQAGARLVQDVEAPVGKTYSLNLNFRFRSAAAIRADELVGSSYNAYCGRDYADIPPVPRQDLGRPIPIHVLVRERRTGAVVLDQVFQTLCITSQGGSGYAKTRTAARVALGAGKYTLEVRSLEDQPGLAGVTTTVSLVSGDGK
ncbi:DUF5625 family protein [Massilia sp. 9I]|uniref:DUF5625 family protein n=1 Tax=Massilia sp. 9I TaxID=2653152 RepID=UPI0012EFBA5D|nr:DUF5625 family protein [Massilia sp. 9I]VXC05906.1 conserved exported hypothetical protein [Massilia sp. 9I]